MDSVPAQLLNVLTAYGERMMATLEGHAVPSLIDEKWQRDGDSFVRRSVELPVAAILVHQLEPELRGLPEYGDAVAALEQHEVIGPRLDELVGTAWGASLLKASSLLDGPALTQFMQGKKDAAALRRAYAKAVGDVAASTTAFITVAPLLGLTSSLDEVELADGLRLLRLDDEVIERCLRTGLLRPTFGAGNFASPPTHGIEQRDVLQRVVGEPSNSTPPPLGLDIERVLWVLRLLRQGRVFMPGTLTYSEDWLDAGALRWGPLTAGSPWFGDYRLGDNEGTSLSQLWQQTAADGIRRRPFLETALRRFSYAADRLRSDDALLDYMISAEALLLTGDGNDKYRGELRFRLAFRGAAFLAGDRGADYDLLRQAYDVRSIIVHGSASPSPPAGFEDLTAFVAAVEDVLRRALRLALTRGEAQSGKGSVLPNDKELLSFQ